ncbi:MAG: pantetheine-phosphate adenylyltransferase [bacterium]
MDQSSTKPRIAVYPGSFDPITNGHLDILKRSKSLFDKIIIAVNDNPLKEFLFTAKERVRLIREVLKGYPEIEVESFQGLLVHYAEKKGARFIIRGLRALSDFEYEFQMDLMNRKLNSKIETVYLMTNQRYSYLSSSIIKEIVKLGGGTRDLIPNLVREKLLEKLKA